MNKLLITICSYLTIVVGTNFNISDCMEDTPPATIIPNTITPNEANKGLWNILSQDVQDNVSMLGYCMQALEQDYSESE